MLRFDTVWSGELAVSAKSDGTYCMELPAHAVSEEVPDGASADSALIQVQLDMESLPKKLLKMRVHPERPVSVRDRHRAMQLRICMHASAEAYHSAGSRGRQWPGGERPVLPGK